MLAVTSNPVYNTYQIVLICILLVSSYLIWDMLKQIPGLLSSGHVVWSCVIIVPFRSRGAVFPRRKRFCSEGAKNILKIIDLEGGLTMWYGAVIPWCTVQFGGKENDAVCRGNGEWGYSYRGVRTNYFTLALLYFGNYFGLKKELYSFFCHRQLSDLIWY